MRSWSHVCSLHLRVCDVVRTIRCAGFVHPCPGFVCKRYPVRTTGTRVIAQILRADTVSIVTKIRLASPRNIGSISADKGDFSHLQSVAGAVRPTQSPVQWVPGTFSESKAYLHLVPRLRMSGAVRLLPLYACMPHTGTAIPFTFLVLHAY
jgi:hypothetical protein